MHAADANLPEPFPFGRCHAPMGTRPKGGGKVHGLETGVKGEEAAWHPGVQPGDEPRDVRNLAMIIVPAGGGLFSIGLMSRSAERPSAELRLHGGFRKVGTAHQKDRIPHLAGCGRNDD